MGWVFLALMAAGVLGLAVSVVLSMLAPPEIIGRNEAVRQMLQKR